MSMCSLAPSSAEFAASRALLDVRTFIDEQQLVDDYGSYLVSLSRVGSDGTWPSDTGPIYGVFVMVDSKALMWTNEPEFTDLGYRAPSDWGSFMALADAIVADGRTPFCLGLESGGFADGWPATDWVELVVLRTAGSDFYDAWIRHDVPFDHPVVVEAIRTIGEMVHRPGFLDTAPADAALRPWQDALLDFTEQPDACLMMPFASFMPGVHRRRRQASRRQLRRSPRSGRGSTRPWSGAGPSPSRSPTAPRSAR